MAVITEPSIASSDSRSRSATRPPYRVGTLTIDPSAREVRVCGQLVYLGRKEYELLCVLAGEPTRVFTREELLLCVWGIRPEMNLPTRTLDSHACRLRTKLKAAGGTFIQNVWGVGYRLADTVEAPRTRAGDGSGRYLVTDTSEYLVEASSEEEARQVYLAVGGAFLGLTELLVQEAD